MLRNYSAVHLVTATFVQRQNWPTDFFFFFASLNYGELVINGVYYVNLNYFIPFCIHEWPDDERFKVEPRQLLEPGKPEHKKKEVKCRYRQWQRDSIRHRIE